MVGITVRVSRPQARSSSCRRHTCWRRAASTRAASLSSTRALQPSGIYSHLESQLWKQNRHLAAVLQGVGRWQYNDMRTKPCTANTCRSDNFYALGCNSTDNSAGGSCEKRFQSDWINVYKTKHQPALKPLTW
jgi:hypothetical protein